MASAKGAKSKRRTSNQAIQTDQQQIAGLQKGKAQRTRQFQKEAGSYRGATNMAIQQIQGQNLGGLRGTPEGNQLAKEYKSRIGDLRTSLPFTLAPVQREYKSDIQGINQDLAGAQLGLQQDQADRLAAIAEIHKTRIQNQKEALKEIATNKSEKRAGVDTAYAKALEMIHMQNLVNKDPNTDDSDKRQIPPKSELEWAKFEESLTSQADVDARSARKAVKALKRRIANTQTPASGQAAQTMQSPFERRFAYPG